MAPTPATTNILYVDYTGSMGARTMQFRFTAAGNPVDAPGVVDPILDAIVPLWHTSVSVIGMRWRDKGSTFSLPIASIPTYVGTASAAFDGQNWPRFLSLSGRGQQSGAEVRLFIYGAIVTTPPDYRFTGTENTLVQTLRNVWGAASLDGYLCTEREDLFASRNYVNVGFNSYYERKQRG